MNRLIGLLHGNDSRDPGVLQSLALPEYWEPGVPVPFGDERPNPRVVERLLPTNAAPLPIPTERAVGAYKALVAAIADTLRAGPLYPTEITAAIDPYRIVGDLVIECIWDMIARNEIVQNVDLSVQLRSANDAITTG